MNQKFSHFTRKIIKRLVELEREAPILPTQVISVLTISHSSLALTYLNQHKNGLLLLLSIFVRPQLYFDTSIISYIITGIQLIYLISLFCQIPLKKILQIHGVLMRTNYLNFCLEISYPSLCFFTQFITILISTLNQFINIETLEFDNKNFQLTKITNFHHIMYFLQIIISLCYYYGANRYFIYAFIFCYSLLNWLNSINRIQFSIYLITIFITLCEILQVKNIVQSFLIIFPLIYKVHSLQTSQNLMKLQQKGSYEEQKFMQISIMIQNKEYLLSLKKLQLLNSSNLILDVKKEFLKQKCINKIMQNIEGNQYAQSILIDTFKKITQAEEESFQLITGVKSILQQKLYLLENCNFTNFSVYFNFLENTKEFENHVRGTYEQFQNKKNRIILLFIYSEILNNFYEARQLVEFKSTFQFDEIDVQKLSYIIATYNQDLKILGISKNTIFNTQQNFQIEQNIPNGIKEYHSKLIEQFLQTGVSKYVKNLNSSFMIKEDNKIMYSIEFGFLINVINELQFITFIQPSIEQFMALILNSDKLITCLSQQFIFAANISLSISQYVGCNVNKLIPNYNENINYFENLEIIVIEDDQEITYSTSANQIIKMIDNKPVYYIINFQSLRRSKMKKTNQTYFSQQQSIFYGNYYSHELKILSDVDVMLQQSVAQEEELKIPYGDLDDEQTINFDKIEELKEEKIHINSPAHKDQSRQRLIRKATFASKLKKQQSQNLEDCNLDEELKNLSKKNNKWSNEFLNDYYNQKILVTNKFYLTLLLSLFAAFIFYLTQTIKLNNDINQLVDDIDILDFGQLTFQPFESNLLIIFSISEYQLYYLIQAINEKQYQQLISFPSQQIFSRYQLLLDHFNSLFKSTLLQNILDNNYLEIEQYTNSSSTEKYNITLRKAFGILLEYQYETLLDFQKNGKVGSYNSNIFFLFKNYMPLKQIVSSLNDQLLQQSITLIDDDKTIVLIFFVVGISVIFFPFLLSYLYFIGITNQINRYYNLLLMIPKHLIESQVSNLKYQIHQINQDNQFIFHYQYNESKFGNKKQNSNLKKTKDQKKLKYSGWKWQICLFILFSLIFILASISYCLTKLYFDGYDEVTKFYKSISDVSIDVASMYSAREVLYFKSSFSYVNNNTMEQLLQVIHDGINRTKTFLNKQAQINNTMMSQSFKEKYQQVISSDLCAKLSPDLQNNTSSFCPLLFDGNMKTGLMAILNTIISNLQNEESLSGFSKRLSIQFYDLEGPFLVSIILSDLFKSVREDLLQQTSGLLSLINIIGISLLCIIGILILFSKKFIFDKLYRKLEISKRFITFLPIQMLLLDEGTERFIKNLMYKSNQY